MATTHIQIDALPERVFAVLADPGTYADWVVGSSMIRDADPSWPKVGSRFWRVTMRETAGDALSRLGINPLTGGSCACATANRCAD